MTAPTEAALLEAILDLRHPVKTAASKWAAENLASEADLERDASCAFFTEGWLACAEAGIQGLVVEERFGGAGKSLLEAMLTLEGLGHGCSDNGLAYALGSQIWSMQTALGAFGTDEQKERWFPGLCAGTQVGAFAITEPDTGSDTYSLSSTATASGDGWVLSGEKAYITLAPVSDVIVAFASTAPERGRWGVSAFLVEADAPGVRVSENRPKMGMRTTPFGDITFDDVEVPAEALLGKLGSGASIFNTAMEAERAYVFATQLGAMERTLESSARYAAERRQFGRPIQEFQSVSNRLADMKLRHETARLLLYKTVALAERGRPTTMAAALAKLGASEGAIESALDAVRIHGAKGYISEFGIDRELRDAVGGIVYSGTSDIQRNIIARMLAGT